MDAQDPSVPVESVPSSSALQQNAPASSPFGEPNKQAGTFELGLENETGNTTATDWSKSYHGLSSQPFAKDVADVLLAPLDENDVEIKPGARFFWWIRDGILNES